VLGLPGFVGVVWVGVLGHVGDLVDKGSVEPGAWRGRRRAGNLGGRLLVGGRPLPFRRRNDRDRVLRCGHVAHQDAVGGVHLAPQVAVDALEGLAHFSRFATLFGHA
jgi:hypothetical protein